ncbi:MAG: glutamine-hydrolyzing GMP synthase [Candidatus Bilamarchaeaceae archaeon]
MKIVIIDNGSQYTHLIKRGYRDLGHAPEIINTKIRYSEVEEVVRSADAVILSGGPNSVYLEKEETLSRTIVSKIRDGELKKPLLGICYGHQMIGYVWGAPVAKGQSAEYGVCEIFVDEENTLFSGLPKKFKAWVSHYDEVKEIPKGFRVLAHSSNCKIEAMANEEKKVYGVQFHPEVWHTENGEKILQNFLKIID